MLDINFILNNQEKFIESMKKRNISFNLEEIVKLNELRKDTNNQLQSLQKDRNAISDFIGNNIKNLSVDERKAKQNEVSLINKQIEEISLSAENISKQFNDLICVIPNILQDTVDYGKDEDDNKLIKEFGNKRTFDFQPLEHHLIGVKNGEIDFERAVKISGSRFVITRGKVAKLERMLRNFMINICNEFGFEEITVPFLVHKESAYRAGQLPKFEDDVFKTVDGKYLIPTSETSMANIYSGEFIKEENLPIQMCAYSPCFRSEVGSAGKDVSGMLRQHQFTKVELFAITKPEDSENMHQRMLLCAEEVLKRLELPYRVVQLCGGDTGPCSSKTYDIEVWLPGQNRYREIASCSNTTDYQSRRAAIKYVSKDNKKDYVHMLNSSSLAIGRTIIAIMENYQNKDGDFEMPKVLKGL